MSNTQGKIARITKGGAQDLEHYVALLGAAITIGFKLLQQPPITVVAGLCVVENYPELLENVLSDNSEPRFFRQHT